LLSAGEQNIQGEDQQKLDVYANEVFIQTLIIAKLYVVLPLKKMMIYG
jgi:fructose-1,6-bisphosphatase